MRFRRADADAPPSDVAQLRAVVALQRGVPVYDGDVSHLAAARYEVDRYDAWVIDDGLPLVVFAAGEATPLARWSDQDSDTDACPDADAIYAAFEARSAEQ